MSHYNVDPKDAARDARAVQAAIHRAQGANPTMPAPQPEVDPLDALADRLMERIAAREEKLKEEATDAGA